MRPFPISRSRLPSAPSALPRGATLRVAARRLAAGALAIAALAACDAGTEASGPATLPAGVALATSGDGQTVQPGTAFEPLVVYVRLPDGRPVEGAAVQWNDPAGLLSPGADTKTDAGGRATALPRVAAEELVGSVDAVVLGAGVLRFTLTARRPAGWKAVPQGGGTVLDVDAGRVLVVTGTGTDEVVKVIARSGGAESVVAGYAELQGAVAKGFLVPGGAVLATAQAVYHSQGGATTRLGATSVEGSYIPPAAYVQAAGSWALWRDGASLYRADLAGGTIATLSTGAVGGISLAPNGDAAWQGPNQVVTWLHAGQAVTPPASAGAYSTQQMSPLTDGVRVVFTEGFRPGQGAPGSTLWSTWYDGVAEGGCTGSGLGSPTFLANGGWLACRSAFLAAIVLNPAGATTSLPGGVPRALGGDGAALLSSEDAPSQLVLSLATKRSITVPVARVCDRYKWNPREFVCFRTGMAHVLGY